MSTADTSITTPSASVKPQFTAAAFDWNSDKIARSYRRTFLDFDNRRDPKTSHYCVRCQKDIKPDQSHRLVHLVDGGVWVLHPDDEAIYVNDGGDVGLHPVGSDCARKLGLEWSINP